ncbi:transcriptional regulator with XRE-family HTH domain [Streptomyces canus]|uniref:Transcriptional regulator with XRE-family HTH domain n=1 Tax=Streptomyces canus TaxID=58343 RepID=A0AAW8FUK1_9ACTN|nr:helix-turn-helix transcriptional regulator [Streptomyces canus]MDQ0913741.1 transcriptional regulator with XRE-family HTH domain [Streptomyces canus]
MVEFTEVLQTTISKHTPLSLRQLADRSGVAASTLSNVMRGRSLPPRSLLQRIVIAADLDDRTGDRLWRSWEAARAEMVRNSDQEALFPDVAPRSRRSGSSQPVPRFGQPDPIRVSNPAELTQALKAVHVWAGEPSLRKLEARSGGRLRRSSVSDMLRSTTLPEYDRFIAFLRACGIEAPNLDVWVFTWRRLKALEKPEIASWMPGMWTVP